MPVLVNGSPADQLPVCDRGFLYGDGVFETLRFQASTIPLWAYHRARLEKSLVRLGIDCDIDVVASDIQQLLSQVDTTEGVLRITVTRGDGQGGYAAGDGVPRRVVASKPLPAMAHASANVRLCDWRLPVQPALAGIKHLNRLDQVMARREWSDDTVFDGLLMDATGALIESTVCNLFIRSGDQWLTPDLSRCGVAGVMRAWLLAEGLPALGYDPDVRDISLTQLLNAEAVFLCNSVRGIVPVTRLIAPEVHWPVDAVTQQLQRTVEALWHA